MSNTTLAGQYLYEQVADGLEKLILDETLKIGDKLPSVRLLSEEYGISMGTAFQAYYHLEGKGLIESRPKSGYYVRFNHRRSRALPLQTEPDTISHDVSVKEMIGSIYQDIFLDDKKMVNLAMAVPHYSLLPVAKLNKSVTAALRLLDDGGTRYAPTQGLQVLREQIALQCFGWGGKVDADDIVVTNGCLEAITICLRTVTRPGDTVAVETPNYFGIYQAIEGLGLKVVEIGSHPKTGFDIEGLKKIITRKKLSAIVAIPNFNNPMGGLMPDERKRELVELITKHQIPLIEDDIYGELYFGRSRPRTCKSFDRKGYVMHCSSFSKSLEPGYRLGYMIPGRFIDTARSIRRMQSISSPSITQASIAHFLQKGRYEYHLKNLRRALHTQYLRYTQAITDYFPDNAKLSRPAGGFVLWVELGKKVNGFRLRNEALQEKIVFMPGKIFSASGRYHNCIRISFGTPYSAQIDDGLQALGQLIRKAQQS